MKNINNKCSRLSSVMCLRTIHLACNSCKITEQSPSSRVEQVKQSVWSSSGETLSGETGPNTKKRFTLSVVPHQFLWRPRLSFPAATLATKTVSTTRHLRCCVTLRSRTMGKKDKSRGKGVETTRWRAACRSPCSTTNATHAARDCA